MTTTAAQQRDGAVGAAYGLFSRDIQKQLDKRLLALRDNPRPPGVKALTGAPGVLRLRVGDDRVLHEVHDAVLIVLVLEVAHRTQV